MQPKTNKYKKKSRKSRKSSKKSRRSKKPRKSKKTRKSKKSRKSKDSGDLNKIKILNEYIQKGVIPENYNLYCPDTNCDKDIKLRIVAMLDSYIKKLRDKPPEICETEYKQFCNKYIERYKNQSEPVTVGKSTSINPVTVGKSTSIKPVKKFFASAGKYLSSFSGKKI
jgi:hypothetical protein